MIDEFEVHAEQLLGRRARDADGIVRRCRRLGTNGDERGRDERGRTGTNGDERDERDERDDGTTGSEETQTAADTSGTAAETTEDHGAPRTAEKRHSSFDKAARNVAHGQLQERTVILEKQRQLFAETMFSELYRMSSQNEFAE